MYRAALLNARLGVETRILPDEAQRIDRFTVAPKLERDLRPGRARNAERRARDEPLADLDVAPGKAGDQAGPAPLVLDDHDPSIAPVRPGKGDAARRRRDDLGAAARGQCQPAARARSLPRAEAAHRPAGHRQEIGRR